MKIIRKISLLCLLAFFIGCAGKEEKEKEGFTYQKKVTTEQKTTPEAEKIPASKKIDLENKGVGPISAVTLGAEVDQKKALQGAEVYKKMCTACHRIDKKFIGPAPKGILERRTPEWVMNMILNPEQMVKEDPLAKELLMEFNGSPMANQNLSKEDARAVLEYFRTL
ncbi:cytochrome c [Lacinutrix sp. C3R15]|uniref:c-type cytochrome n=1 Tax=Flavobacteriaceae TaxID=49546 RepID=UPI001C09BDAE|nr:MULTISPECIES: cytochrome c [Flavobacteriaceae]MBU2938939.1 cytochrome c [Lacinutrix sp. C3R15]MDO6622252.1 cytochrome c [Oceanihabitans sp. 1_MG-2023]